MANINTVNEQNGQLNGLSSTRIVVEGLAKPKPYAVIDGEKYYLDIAGGETFYTLVDRCNEQGKLIEEWGFENPPAEPIYDPGCNKR